MTPIKISLDVLKLRRVTVQEQITSPPANRDIPDTEVLAVEPPSPVFVDTTGRRRRLLRRIAYGFVVVCMLYGGLICVSLAGGPVSSSAILPLPALDGSGGDTPDARPAPAPTPVAGSSPTRAVVEAMPRRRSAFATNAEISPKPSATPNRPVPTPTPAPTPSPRATTARPIESSTTTPAPSASASTGTSTPPSPSDPPTTPASPVAPLPPGDGSGSTDGVSAGTGGTGGSAGDGSNAVAAPAAPSVSPDPAGTTAVPGDEVSA